MKLVPLLFSLALLLCVSVADVVTLNLKDGSVIKGEADPAKAKGAREVVVTTGYGIIRVPVADLTDQSKKALGIGLPLTPAEYEARIASLEKEMASLKEENARLRKGATSQPAATAVPRTAPQVAPAPVAPRQPAAASSHSISSTGKRHNSGCRYYGSGRSCGPTDGVACKICGG